jgi:filamin
VTLSSTLGYGGLSLSIEGPSKADIECHDNEDGSCLVNYRPTEPGVYIVNVKFADKHVSGAVALSRVLTCFDSDVYLFR